MDSDDIFNRINRSRFHTVLFTWLVNVLTSSDVDWSSKHLTKGLIVEPWGGGERERPKKTNQISALENRTRVTTITTPYHLSCRWVRNSWISYLNKDGWKNNDEGCRNKQIPQRHNFLLQHNDERKANGSSKASVGLKIREKIQNLHQSGQETINSTSGHLSFSTYHNKLLFDADLSWSEESVGDEREEENGWTENWTAEISGLWPWATSGQAPRLWWSAVRTLPTTLQVHSNSWCMHHWITALSVVKDFIRFVIWTHWQDCILQAHSRNDLCVFSTCRD